jgi:hypothetical protein
MTTITAIILIAIFLFLSGLHFYWGFGGKWGSRDVIPTKDDNQPVAMPGVIPTFIVAFGLLVFGFVVLVNTVELKIPFLPNFLYTSGLWIIAGIFILRAIGEFNYIGFFKKHKNSKFGQKDTKIYSPLCLLIGVLAIILEMNK